MKQQFLNYNGMAELIGYIKQYIQSDYSVKPYASLSVFPKIGEQNIIYIDTTTNSSYYWDDNTRTYKALDVQTWANLTGKPSTFPPSSHTHDDRYFTETEMNSKLAGKANSSHTHKKADITDFPTSMPASDVPAWAKASTKPTYTKAEVGLGNVDNTADKDKSVKYATSAGSAGTASSVDWSGVKNPPTTYAPSAHTHGSGDITSLSADKITGVIGIDHLPAGALERCKIVADDTARFKLTKNDIQNGDTVKVGTDANAKMYLVIDDTKLSSEAGYTIYTAGSATSVPWSGVTGKPSTFTPSSHTHNYAGSSSAGGNANWANGASYANYANKIACNPTEDKSTNGLFMFQYSENTTICPDSAWWSVVRTQHPGYNNGYWQEMAYNFDSDIIKFRRNVNGSKSAWKTIAFTDSKVSSAGYADSAGSANSVAWGNVSGRPSSMPASDVYSWAKASSKPSYTKAEVGLGNVDNTADANKSVRYAASAGSATTATNATNANYLNMVANNEIRFNKPSWTTKNDLWIGYKWADSPGADLINAYHFGNGNGGYASIAAASVNVTNVNAAEYVKIGQPNNSNNGAIKLYGASPYIDFHAGGTNTDYTSRIVAYSDRIEFVFA